MAKKAARLSQDEWAADLNELERNARDELVAVWDTNEREVWDRLSRLTVRTIDEDTLRDVTVEGIVSVVEGDPGEVLLRLGDFVVDRAMERLTANQLWDFARSHGFAPREGRDVAVSERMKELNGRYMQGVLSARPTSLPLLGRSEVDRVVQALTDPDGPRAVVVTGGPGSGKSTVLAEACRRLAELGVVVGPLRLDAAADAWTAEELGVQRSIGFGGPPARVLARAAGGEQAVLVVDQLDALSSLAGRGETVMDGARHTLAQARATAGVRVLIGCRAHDLQHDRRLRRLLYGDGAGDSDAENLLTIAVGDLDDAQLNEGLALLGLSATGWPSKLRKLLANPLNLSILANIVEDTDDQAYEGTFDPGTVRTRHDLLSEYDRRLARRFRTTLGADVYTPTVSRIARIFSDSGQLSFDRAQVGEIPDTIDALLHEGVLATDGTRLRFFHQEFFDYVFALQHVRNGQTALDILLNDPQDLIRRGQVCAVLMLERQQDWLRYVMDLGAVLSRPQSRTHIRAAVLTWLTDLAAVEDDELRIVAEIAANDQDSLCQRATQTLASELFVRALNTRRLLPILAANLSGHLVQAEHAVADHFARIGSRRSAYVLYEAARYIPEAASQAVIILAGDAHAAMQWGGALLRAVLLAGPTAGPHTAELFSRLTRTLTKHALTTWASPEGISETQPDVEHARDIATTIQGLFADQGVHALNTLAKHAPAHAAEAIHTWLECALQIGLYHGAHHVFDQASPLPRQQTGLGLFSACATHAPIEFAHALTPLLIDQLERSPVGRSRWRPAGEPRDPDQGLLFDTLMGVPCARSFHQEIFDALRTALRLSAERRPQAAAAMIRLLTESELLSGHQLAAAALSACAEPLLDSALVWASDPRVRGLPSGLASGWAWGEVLAHVAAIGSGTQPEASITLAMDAFGELELATLAANRAAGEGATPSLQSEDQRGRAQEQLVALTLIERRLGEQTPSTVDTRRADLEGLLGPVPATPEPQVIEVIRQSPIPDSEARDFSDNDWLDAVRTYHDSRADQGSGWFEGGAHEVAAQLENATKAQPGRFARLAGLIGPDANPVYVKAVLRAIGSAAEDLDADALQATIDAVRVIAGWPGREFNSPLCDVIGGLASFDLPDDILDLTTAIAITRSTQQADVSDGGDLVVAGLSRDRGQATYAMARLLAPAETRDSRAARFLPAARIIAADPDTAVRVLAPPLIVKIFLSDHAAASEVAELWLDHATEETLRAPELDRLAFQLLTSGAACGNSMIERMLRSSIAEVRTRGGGLAALASLRRDSLPTEGDALAPDVALAQAMHDAAARKGVAQLLAQVVDQLQTASERERADRVVADRDLLIQLLNDDDHDVRESAARYAFDITAPLSRYTKLLAATASSLAFREHPTQTLHALHRLPGDIPEEALKLCEEWLRYNADDAGDIRTGAAGDAYYVVDIVFSIHSGAPAGGKVRERCIVLIDRLIEIGAFDVEKKIEAAVLT